MEDVKVLKTIEEIRAISDPYRNKILNCFYRIGEPITVKQLADELGEVPAKVHYHVKKMEKAGVLTLVYTKKVNGIIAKYYEPTARVFNLVGEDGAMDPVKINAAQKAIAEVFEDGKRTFLKQMELLIDEVKDKDKNKSKNNKRKSFNNQVGTENIYLTDEEAMDLLKYISDLFEKKRKKPAEEKEDIKEYQIFYAITKIKDK